MNIINGKTYEVKFDLFISQDWINDGADARTTKKRIREELPGMLCPYAYSEEITVKGISVRIKKSKEVNK